MKIEELLNNKALKSKEKTKTLGEWLVSKKIKVDDLIAFAKTAKDSPKATCIEALELATRKNPKLANAAVVDFVTMALADESQRVKWESAKVIGNIAPLFAGKMNKAITCLLDNSEHEGTVVRWSAAFALGEIVKTNHASSKKLIPAIENIAEHEEKNSIKKIYRDALKKVKH
ncbi:MAG TPA: hypothetical protein VD905_03335 [Flavobacteriales bacterium]|nr:hypothetical protein [Flavobacteriales bacterium]